MDGAVITVANGDTAILRVDKRKEKKRQRGMEEWGDVRAECERIVSLWTVDSCPAPALDQK